MPIKRKDIIYPIFLECSVLCEDPIWAKLFENLAYGKCPKSCYISKSDTFDTIVCTIKGSEFTYKIERKDPELIYEELYHLFTENLKLGTTKSCSVESEEPITEEWSDIRRKNVKDIMYEKFVLEMMETYELTHSQCKDLLATIILSIMFKTIVPKDIIYKDGRIIKINGIEFSKGNFTFKNSICLPSEKISIEQNSDTKLKMSENWEKYLKCLKNNC